MYKKDIEYQSSARTQCGSARGGKVENRCETLEDV
jgi:hypothetical protein